MRQNLITRQQEVALNLTYKNFGLNTQFSPFDHHSSIKFNPSDKRSNERSDKRLFHIQALKQHPTPLSPYRRVAEKALESNLDGSKMWFTFQPRFSRRMIGGTKCLNLGMQSASHVCSILQFTLGTSVSLLGFEDQFRSAFEISVKWYSRPAQFRFACMQAKPAACKMCSRRTRVQAFTSDWPKHCT